MTDHANFAPSAAKRWMTCPGSHLPSLYVPRRSSPDADEGTRLHDVAAGYIKATMHDVSYAITKDDQRFLQPYLDYALALAKRSIWWGVEQEVTFNDSLWGTSDLMALATDGIHVGDLKTGRGVQVDPEDNAQMLTYAACGMVDKALGPRLRKYMHADTPVHLTIVQPPQDGPLEVRTWTTTLRRVNEHAFALEAAMAACMQPQAPFVTGDHCRFCPVKPNCPELTGMARSALALPSLVGLSPREVSGWLDKLDLMQQFIDAVREQAHDAIQSGVVIPGWGLKPKRATRMWSDEERVAEIARAKRLRIFQPLKLMSPAMAEKAHGEKLPEEISDMIVAISSGTNLVKDPTVTDEIKPKTKVEAFRNLKLRIK